MQSKVEMPLLKALGSNAYPFLGSHAPKHCSSLADVLDTLSALARLVHEATLIT